MMVPKPTRPKQRVDYTQMAIPKQGQVIKKGKAYEAICRAVLARDHGRCVVCGSSENLTPHHKVKRSRGRMDTLNNMETLCVECHRKADEG